MLIVLLCKGLQSGFFFTALVIGICSNVYNVSIFLI